MKYFEDKLRYILKKELNLDNIDIEIPPDSKLGDYALPCFSLSKIFKKAPQIIAIELRDNLSNNNEIKKYFELVKADGPYLNFFVNKSRYIEETLKLVFKKKYKFGKKKKEKIVVLIESPGPNTNKPLHLGHLRNILLGQSLFNMTNFIGEKAHLVNIVNDRGVHICKSMLAYQKFGDKLTPEKAGIKSDHFVGDFYVKYNQLEKTNPEIEKEIQEMLIKWEKGDKEILKLWRQMNKWALSGFKETYKRLNFKTKDYFESKIYLKGKEIVLDGLKRGIFQKDENGAIIVDLSKEGLGKKVLLRSEGTAVYITQDIYLAKLRYDEYKFDKMIYVVGNEQEYHFKVLFEIFKKLKWPFADKCYHFAYGMVALPEGKMKSREGKVIDADNLIDQVVEEAKNEIKKRYPNLSENEINQRAELIALSAIKFFFLKYDPMKDFVFNPNESLSFEGETGPYVEYAYARINSVFKKFLENKKVNLEDYIKDANLSLLKEINEFELSKLLSNFPEMVENSSKKMNPSILARYLIDLVKAFGSFYQNNPIISSDEELTKARLYLMYCVQIVIKSGLNLLGIKEISEM